MQSILDPTKSRSLPIVKRALDKSIESEITDSWNYHIKSFALQGNFLRIYNKEQGTQHGSPIYIYNLPRGTVKFLLKSALDTLPTNNNLCKMRKTIKRKL